jgi:hypothetical protein
MSSHAQILNVWNARARTVTIAIVSFAGVSLAYCGNDPRVETVVLDSKGVTQIPVCAGYVTTVLFPRPVSGIVGYGLTSDPAAEEGWIQYAHPGDSGLVTLRVLKPELNVAYMTVVIGEDLYSFALANNPGQAALSVKLTDGERQIEQPPIGQAPVNSGNAQATPAPPEHEVNKEDVINARPVYHPEKLRTLLELAKESTLLRGSSPELYQGYEERKVSNVSDYGDVVATIEEVHRFPADDAIVLFGRIENRGAKTVSFDPAAITIGIGDRQYPSAFVDCVSAVNPGQTIKFGVIGQGDVDGGRAHLAIRNTFRVLLPKYSAQPGNPVPTQSPRRLSESKPAQRRVRVANEGKAGAKPSPSIQKANRSPWMWPWQRAQASPSPSPSPKSASSKKG